MTPFRIFLLVVIVAILCSGVYDFLRNFENNGCEMTYMFITPQYMRVDLDKDLQEKFPRYGLYLYGEGSYAQQAKKSGFKMSGIPVLFIPGNAGSYRQVRSLGSVSQQKAQDAKTAFHFNYFSLDFDEELSGMYGMELYEETEFAYECIKKILSLYDGATSQPKSVVIVGHSMGGMVARGLFTLPDFKPELVTTIITQATPHQVPAVAIDTYIQRYYDEVNTYWREKENTTVKDVTVLSTGGGYRDLLVRSGLTSLNGLVKGDRGIYTNTMSVPRAWVSTDHLCHVWCKQIVLATTRALFDMVDKTSKQIAVNPFYRLSSFAHHFHRSPGPKKFKGAYDEKVLLDKEIKWEKRVKLSWKLSRDSLTKTRYSVTEIPPSPIPAEYAEPEWSFVAISNINNEKWVGTCDLREKIEPSKSIKPPKKENEHKQCTEIKNEAPYAELLPPLYSENKVVHLGHDDLKTTSHIVTVLPKTKNKVMLSAELYKIKERHLDYNTTGLVDFLYSFPRSVMELDIVVNKTSPSALFYNISLLGLAIPLQAYTAHLTTLQCSEPSKASSSVAVLKLYIPWAMEPSYSTVQFGKSGSLPLKLMTPRPSNIDSPAQLHVYLNPSCTYRLAIAISWTELFGQFVRFYGSCLPGFIAIQVLMVLSWQLKSLDEQGFAPSFSDSHARWAQPWRVVPLALGIRFMLFYPEDDNVALKLGLPSDDRAWLESHGLWYAALPIMLYLTAYAVMGLYASLAQTLLTIMGVISSPLVNRCIVSAGMNKALTRCQYVLYVGAGVVAALVCGAAGLSVVYYVLILKTVGLYVTARQIRDQREAPWSRFYLHVSLVVLIQVILALNCPSLIVWLKNIQYSAVLTVDPSRTVGVVAAISALIFSVTEIPQYPGELYGVASALLYISCLFMVLYTLTSTYVITYFLYFALIIISSLSLLSYWLRDTRPSETTKAAEILDLASRDDDDQQEEEVDGDEGQDD